MCHYRHLFLLIATAALMVLGGCESANRRILFHPSNRTNVQIIGLIPPENPPQIIILDTFAQEVGGAFGLIGYAVGAGMTEADMNERSRIFARSIAGIPFDFRELMTEQVKENLTNAGYTVKIVNVPRVNSAQFLPSYHGMPVQADAYLDMAIIAVGFVNNPAQLFEPWISLHVRLISPDSQQLFYRDWFLYGQSSDWSPLPYDEPAESMPLQYADELPVSSEYHFADFYDLTSKKESAIEGLKIGIRLIAEKIGRKLTVHDSLVYIYRPDVFLEHYVDLSVTIDDYKIGMLKNDSHLLTTLPSGRHVINIKGPKKFAETTQTIDVEKGKSYYIRVELLKVEKLEDIGAGKSKATSVPVDLGRAEVSRTKSL
jgi:hypothetical protein